MNYLVLPKGHIFFRPGTARTLGADGLLSDWTGYELAEDVYIGSRITPRQFIPRGDVPIPSVETEMPKWLQSQIRRANDAARRAADVASVAWQADDKPSVSLWERLKAAFSL